MNYDEIQNDEVEVLRSIFSEEFAEVESKAAWSKAANRSFKLRLKAQQDGAVTVTILVKFTATYPKSAPLLFISDHDGLERGAVDSIKLVLEKMPEQLLGTEMIFEIATAVQSSLDNAAVAKLNLANLPSLEAERTSQEVRAARLAHAKQQESLREQQQQAREQEQTLQRMVDQEAMRRMEARDQTNTSVSVSGLAQAAYDAETIAFDRLVHADELSFNVVELQTSLGRGPVAENYLAVPRTNKQASTLFCLKRVSIDASRDRKYISDIEETLEKLRRLKHRSLLQVFDFKLTLSSNVWNLDILCEYHEQGSLTGLLQLAGSIRVPKARVYVMDILHALEFIHKQGLIHGMLHTSNICFSTSSFGEQILKLTDVAFKAQLHDFKLSNNSRVQTSATNSIHLSKQTESSTDAEGTPPGQWKAPEHSKSRKTDIWSLGVVLLQMVLGLEVIHGYPSAQALFANERFSRPFLEFIRPMFMTNPRKRPSAFELLPYEFLRTDANALDNNSAIKDNASHSDGLQKLSLSRHASNGNSDKNSRYLNDWAETGRIGKGAFGEVVRARNRNDGRIYAIKKIQSKTASTLNKVLPEVHLLASLNHPYVVRYFGAWPEEESVHADFDDADLINESSSTNPSREDLFSSVGAFDFISSSNHGRIVFDDGEDEESDDEDEAEESGIDSTNLSSTSSSASVRSENENTKQDRVFKYAKWTLYIQMEFCERSNLRDLLYKGVCQSDKDECWRLFRQILEGLVHIHGHGIIHRDLKPENIFIDLANNPKIGDFGLATAGVLQLLNKVETEQAAHQNDLTRSIGTAIYAAPELASGMYNEKADMYALGLIFFEMCTTFKTNMERVQTLFRLRDKTQGLPATLIDKPKESQIVESLIKHEPRERPSSSTLLNSGILPEQINDEHVRVALSGLSDPNSPYFRRMMSALFSQPSSQLVQDQMWEADTARNIDHTLSTSYSLHEAFAKHKIESVFRRHGAIQMERQKLIPKSDIYGATNKVAQFLDSSGTIVQLPFDLTLPWARKVAKSATMVPQKTFTFGQVFRSVPYGGAPSSSNEVDFDILSSCGDHNLRLKDAEVLKVMDEILEEIPSVRNASICFHISHDRLIDLILDFCRITGNRRDAVKEIVGKLDVQQWTWEKIRVELRASDIGVPASALDDLAKFAFRDTTEHCFNRIRTLIKGSILSQELHACFADLRNITRYLEKLDVKRKFYISPLSSFNHKFYRGNVMFQCLYDGKKRDVLAAGGRYDSLLEELRPKSKGQDEDSKAIEHAVSISIAWEKLVISLIELENRPSAGRMFLKQGVSKEEAPSNKSVIARRCEVLVASLNPLKYEDFSLRILVDLWGARVSAELAADLKTPEELFSHHRKENYHFIVFIKHEADPAGKPELKVKSLSRKEDFDLRQTDLAAFLRGEIRKENVRDITEDRSWYPRTQARTDDYLTGVDETQMRVLAAPQKNKKTNKWKIMDDAKATMRRHVRSLSKGPIACIEIHEDAFVALKRTRFSSVEGWRKLVQDAPPKDRQYLQDIKSLLETLYSEHQEATSCFIYNFRSGSCTNYDFER